MVKMVIYILCTFDENKNYLERKTHQKQSLNTSGESFVVYITDKGLIFWIFEQVPEIKLKSNRNKNKNKQLGPN